MSSFFVLVILGVVLAVLGLVFLILSLHESSVGEYQAASRFGEMFAISFICATFLIIIAFIAGSKGKQQSQEIYQKAVTAYNKGADVYIDGEPVSSDFNIKGIDLKKYTVRIKDNDIFLISKN